MSTLAIQGQSEGDGEQGPQIELQCRGDSMEVTVDATSVEGKAKGLSWLFLLLLLCNGKR